jgi:hypothetical protein
VLISLDPADSSLYYFTCVLMCAGDFICVLGVGRLLVCFCTKVVQSSSSIIYILMFMQMVCYTLYEYSKVTLDTLSTVVYRFSYF